jgi:hypothetical protein
MDSWKSEDLSAIKQNNFLGVALADNEQAHIAFETKL